MKSQMNAGKKVLLVDDDQFLIDLLAEKIKKAGFEAFTANTGDEAIAQVTQNRPDLILLDLMMPGMDGLSVLKKLKSTEEHKNIPVVVLTSLSDPSVVNEIKSHGGSGYLLKDDHTLDTIVQAIQNLV
jgi:two-component system, OmpR family, response regulator